MEHPEDRPTEQPALFEFASESYSPEHYAQGAAGRWPYVPPNQEGPLSGEHSPDGYVTASRQPSTHPHPSNQGSTPPHASIGSAVSRTSNQSGSGVPSRNPSDKSLFVSGLHPDCEFTHIHERFQKYGKIFSCRVLRDAKSGNSRCIGYINYAYAPDAARAIANENGQPGPQGGGPMTIRYAEDDPAFVPEETKKIFIRYVPLNMPTDKVREVYSQYGTVTECTVMPDMSSAAKAEGEPWNMAYVTFTSAEEATYACARTNRSFALGDRHALLVKPAETLATRAQRQRKHDGGSGSGHFVGGSRSGHEMSSSSGAGVMQPMGFQTAAGAGGFQAPAGYQIAYLPQPNGQLIPVLMPMAQQQPVMLMQPAQQMVMPMSMMAGGGGAQVPPMFLSGGFPPQTVVPGNHPARNGDY
jgi:hypothetical protein